MALGGTVHPIDWPYNSNAIGCDGWYYVSWNTSCDVGLFSNRIDHSKEASQTGFPIQNDKTEMNKAANTK